VEFLVISIFHETKIPTIPSVGASLKKWWCYTPILPKALAHPKKKSKKKKMQKIGSPAVY
jgi:hypothetical protein